MIWLLAALVAGVYLLRRALPRQRGDRDLVLAVALTLVLCAALLVAIGIWRASQAPVAPPQHVEPVAPGADV